jgi:hypothetical protein
VIFSRPGSNLQVESLDVAQFCQQAGTVMWIHLSILPWFGLMKESFFALADLRMPPVRFGIVRVGEGDQRRRMQLISASACTLCLLCCCMPQ